MVAITARLPSRLRRNTSSKRSMANRLRIRCTDYSACGSCWVPPLPIFVQVFILNDFKPCNLQVHILGTLRQTLSKGLVSSTGARLKAAAPNAGPPPGLPCKCAFRGTCSYGCEGSDFVAPATSARRDPSLTMSLRMTSWRSSLSRKFLFKGPDRWLRHAAGNLPPEPSRDGAKPGKSSARKTPGRQN